MYIKCKKLIQLKFIKKLKFKITFGSSKKNKNNKIKNKLYHGYIRYFLMNKLINNNYLK
jgi:hypothetical protein